MAQRCNPVCSPSVTGIMRPPICFLIVCVLVRGTCLFAQAPNDTGITMPASTLQMPVVRSLAPNPFTNFQSSVPRSGLGRFVSPSSNAFLADRTDISQPTQGTRMLGNLTIESFGWLENTLRPWLRVIAGLHGGHVQSSGSGMPTLRYWADKPSAGHTSTVWCQRNPSVSR